MKDEEYEKYLNEEIIEGKFQGKTRRDIFSHIIINVAGAGDIRIGKYNCTSCGGKNGFSFDCEWGRHGFAGGVLSNGDAKRLAEHILETLDKYPE
jgi:hypothetical protein